MPRCALNFEEHGVRYAGLDRSAAAVNTLPRLRFRRGLVCGSRGIAPLYYPLALNLYIDQYRLPLPQEKTIKDMGKIHTIL
jgi:hypothetical protein